MDAVRVECKNLIVEYFNSAKGPSKFEALAEFFQNWIIDSEVTELLKTIDQTYEQAMNKVKLMISET